VRDEGSISADLGPGKDGLTWSVAAVARRFSPPVPGKSSLTQYECNTPTEKGSPHTRISMTVAPARKSHADLPPSTGGSAAVEGTTCRMERVE
jgi:hypothetical protein